MPNQNHLDRAPARQTLNVVHALVDRYRATGEVDLTAEQQTLLACCYAYGLSAGARLADEGLSPSVRKTFTAYNRAASQSSELLMASLRGLVVHIVADFAQRRLGRAWAAKELDDLISDGVVVALESCTSYDPRHGTSLAQWVAVQLRSHLRSLQFDRSGGVRPREWNVVARAIREVAGPDALDGQAVGGDLTAMVRDHLTGKAVKRGRARGLDEQAAASYAHDSLSRQSVNRALREMGEILAMARGVVSLDAPNPDGDGVFGDQVAGMSDDLSADADYSPADALASVLAVFPGRDVELFAERYGSSGGELPYRAMAEREGVHWLELRHRVDRVQAGVTAPHAQYCAFVPGLEDQFDLVGDAATADQVGGILRRGAAQLQLA
jgi:hypothetical protein